MIETHLAPAPRGGVHGLLERTRASWRRAMLLRTLCIALAATLLPAALLIGIDLLDPLSTASRGIVRLLPLAAGAGTLAILARRIFPGPDDRRLALLLEERHPQLEAALSTSLEPLPDTLVTRLFQARLEKLLRIIPIQPPPSRLKGPAGALGLSAIGLILVTLLSPGGPAGVRDRWVRLMDSTADRTVREERARTRAGARVATGLGVLRVTIEPPAYAGLAAYGWDGEELVTPLPGSRLRVRGETAGEGEVRAAVIGGPALTVEDGAPWQVERLLSSTDRGILLESRRGEEVVARVVIPVAMLQDQPPEVELAEPARDLLVATPSGTVVVHASARDDYGVGDFQLSWIRSRGSGESFTFEEGTWRWTSVARDGGTVRGEYRLDLGRLGLEPGDVLHLRAVARDRNTVGGPGEGVSATRAIRIAREEEMGEVTTLTGFPIEADREPILSQRMIILLTEELLQRATRLSRAALLREAAEIADEQARLRNQVRDEALTPATGAEEEHDEAEAEHDHDANPILSVNGPLLEAYNAMWSAEGSLRIGELRASLPSQYRALSILQEMREAERVFARGRQQVTPIDLAAARGTGKLDQASPAARTAAPASPVTPAARADLEALLGRLGRLGAVPASLELSALAARLLAEPGADPGAAALVGRAGEIARAGDLPGATRLVLRARALLSPAGAGQAGGAPSPAAVDPTSAAYFRALGGAP